MNARLMENWSAADEPQLKQREQAPAAHIPEHWHGALARRR